MIQRLRYAFFAALLIVFLWLLSPAGPVGSATNVAWDPRLNELNVTLVPAADCSTGCWQLVEARYEDPDEAAGLHHIWAVAQNADGQQLAGQPWTVAWPGGSAVLQTKPFPEQADFPMYASYAPDRGESGPYRAFAGTNEAQSDAVWGMGLPLKHHINFRLTWRWASSAPTPLPTYTPEPSPTPEPMDLPYKWFVPVALGWAMIFLLIKDWP